MPQNGSSEQRVIRIVDPTKPPPEPDERPADEPQDDERDPEQAAGPDEEPAPAPEHADDGQPGDPEQPEDEEREGEPDPEGGDDPREPEDPRDRLDPQERDGAEDEPEADEPPADEPEDLRRELMRIARGLDASEHDDEPAAADAFLAGCARVFVELAQKRLEHTPPFRDGYLSSYGIWAPGTVVRTQIDNATMLSPAMYRDQVLPHDRAIMGAFDYSLIHLHSGCLHVVEALYDVDELQAIQVSIDHPGGPLATEVMPILERIAQHKPLIVTGPVTPAELDSLRQLGSQGSVCLSVRLELDRK